MAEPVLRDFIDLDPEKPRKFNFRLVLPLAIIGAGSVLLLGGLYFYYLYQESSEQFIPINQIHSSEASPSGLLTVDISGAVNKPGIYTFEPGSRWYQGIKKAGGLHQDHHAEWVQKNINLAKVLEDEVKIYIPFVDEDINNTKVISTDSQSKKISLNTANQTDLESISGIGPVLAEKIIIFRDEKGGFKSWEEVENAPGIGPKILEILQQNSQLDQ